MVRSGAENVLYNLASELAAIAEENHMKLSSCAERLDLSHCNISHGSCIDKELIEKITGCRIEAKKDRNQREECGVVTENNRITERPAKSFKAFQMSLWDINREV